MTTDVEDLGARTYKLGDSLGRMAEPPLMQVEIREIVRNRLGLLDILPDRAERLIE